MAYGRYQRQSISPVKHMIQNHRSARLWHAAKRAMSGEELSPRLYGEWIIPGGIVVAEGETFETASLTLHQS